MEIKRIDTIKKEIVHVIRESYQTVADDFGITRENGASNPAFIELHHLQEMDEKGIELYGAFYNKECIGFVGVEDAGNGIYYLEKLAVVQEYRHKGYGKQLIDFVFDRVKSLGGERISIGIINEHTVLKKWYTDYGFVEIEVKTFPHLPFTVCLMAKNV